MGSFPSRKAADWCVCTMSLYIGASRRLIGTRAPIYRRVACNEILLVVLENVIFSAAAEHFVGEVWMQGYAYMYVFLYFLSRGKSLSHADSVHACWSQLYGEWDDFN